METVFIVGYPATAFQYGNRFLRLDLVAGIAAGLSGFYFFRSRNVKFAEYLFERLREIGGTLYSVTGSYEGTETLDRKLKRIMEQNAGEMEGQA